MKRRADNKGTKRRVIDIHCHILPGIDDGSQSMETTLKMITIAAKEGTTHMIATPHYKKGHHNATPDTIKRLVADVQDLADERRQTLLQYARSMMNRRV